jgi:hypothetical protein
MDPLTKKFPFLSPYQFASNKFKEADNKGGYLNLYKINSPELWSKLFLPEKNY